ncbi:MAG: ABC transporter ATP-binding protein [Oscillospiraceae bacterium]|nr:ABC transporter ATP-binding protein [Oscillospiraceae bacterium]
MPENDIVMEACGISRTYPGDKPVHALKETTISFRRGQFTAIIGKSGSGKSTLLRILATLDPSDSGELYIEGEKVSALKDADLARFRRRRIGFIHQDYNLFPEYTAYENIVFPIHLDGRSEDPEKIDALMENLGISHCRDKFPHEMSGGEQQRVSIARALAIEPAVILADEPTGNLDSENSLHVTKILKLCQEEYRQCIILVTHDESLAAYADRIITIRDGCVSGQEGQV